MTISGSDYEPSLPADLDKTWMDIEGEIDDIHDIYDKAITAFLRMSRAQFFWDVKKRMGRFMMNGILLSHGVPIINVPAMRQTEFNQLMLEFYLSAKAAPMNRFLRSCLNPKIIENFK